MLSVRKIRHFILKRGVCAAFALGFLLLFSIQIFAASLTEYREKIRQAKNLTQTLGYLNEEESSLKEYAENERNTLTELRASLPVSEKVEWQGTSVETNNQWLKDRLDEYEDETDLSKRQTILTAVGERLSSIEEKINELENPPVSDRSKDEDKRKLAEILRRDEFKKPEEQGESIVQKTIKAILEWLSKLFSGSRMPSGANSGFELLAFILQILVFALILGAIGFLIYRFAPFLLNRYRTRVKKEKKERVILGERLAADEDSHSLFSEAERLAREGNLRQAIRKGYIALLCELSDRKIIGLSQNKTNRDYLRDVRSKKELHRNLSGLTSNFERHWYGFDTAELEDWEEFKNGYQKAVSSK